MLEAVELDLLLALRLVFALALSAVIGWDRERRKRPAGLRTHMLVGLAATLVMVVAGSVAVSAQPYGEAVRVDPTRAIQAIVTGISFLGAGTIFISSRATRRVQGLTTAASILATAAVGITVGVGRYVLATIATLLAFGVLAVLGDLEKRWSKGPGPPGGSSQ